LKTLV